MFSGQSVLGVSAAGLYSLVLFACLGAAVLAAIKRAPAKHTIGWTMVALVFAILVVLRAYNLEEMLRQDLRSWLREEGLYQDRREYQRPIAASVIVLLSPIVFFLVYRVANARSSLRNFVFGIAWLGALVMVGLLGLRIISLHQIDALLYGPLKLNWITDIGASLAVLLAAVFYIGLSKRRL